jgi:hypothetical protein
MRHTSWYPPSIKPYRVGVYEKLSQVYEKGYQYWNGEFWGRWCTTPAFAYAARDEKSAFQNEYWRGFTEEVKE